MKLIREALLDWVPFAFAVGLCFIVLSSLAKDMRFWEPAFYSFLPMCFLFAGFGTHRMRRELRELREKVGRLESSAQAEVVSVPGP
ncbi:MAG: hypothetical protein ACM3SO_09635 [Betaproteobacteria bacterium]